LRIALVGALVCAAGLSTACFSIQVVSGNQVPVDRVARIQPGTTTRSEILEWFGAPEDYTDPSGLRRIFADGVAAPEDVLALPYADVLVFELTRGRVRGVLLLLYNQFEVHVANNRLVVFFDDQDRVLYYGYRSGADELQ
jgi:hypothetical protein